MFLGGHLKGDLAVSSVPSFQVNVVSTRMRSIISWYKLLWLLLLPGSCLPGLSAVHYTFAQSHQYIFLCRTEVNLI